MPARVLAPWLLAALLGCDPPPIPTPPVVRQEVLMNGVVLDRFFSDRLSDRTYVKEVSLDRTGGIARGKGVHAELYEPEGPPQVIRAELLADRAIGDLRGQAVRLEGNVRVTDVEKRTLRTERLDYDGPTDHLSTLEKVTVEGANFKAEGIGLDGHPKAGTLEVGSPLTGIVSDQRRPK